MLYEHVIVEQSISFITMVVLGVRVNILLDIISRNYDVIAVSDFLSGIFLMFLWVV